MFIAVERASKSERRSGRSLEPLAEPCRVAQRAVRFVTQESLISRRIAGGAAVVRGYAAVRGAPAGHAPANGEGGRAV
jgi:hypothetical protein